MAKIALITLKYEKEEKNSRIYSLKNFFRKTYNIVKKPRLDKYINQLSFDEATEFSVIALPYKLRELDKDKSGKIIENISDICETLNIDKCMVPISLCDMFSNHSLYKNNNLYHICTGMLVFKALLVLILTYICKNKKVNLNDMDIALVQGDKEQEAITFVKMLSPYIKYLTLITNNSEEIEEEINNIYAESGLAVGITDDMKRGIKDKDIIINLGNLNSDVLESKVNKRAFVINYGDNGINKSISKNTIINGVDITLPKHIYSKIENHVHIDKSFNKLEIAEFYLYYKIYKDTENLIDINDKEVYIKMAEEFILSGFKIVGLIGRHGILDKVGFLNYNNLN